MYYSTIDRAQGNVVSRQSSDGDKGNVLQRGTKRMARLLSFSRVKYTPLSDGATATTESTDLVLPNDPYVDETELAGEEDDIYPNEEEMHGPTKLRRIGDHLLSGLEWEAVMILTSQCSSWTAYLIAFVELCERFSYYGTTAVFTNFVQRPLPDGSNTGAGGRDRVSGALGLGPQAATALVTFNTFWVCIIPLFGAYIADTHLGRFKTVCWSVAIALVGHIIMIISAVPSVIVNQKLSLSCFIIAVVVMGVGTGGFKANISPLVAEQYNGPERPVIRRLKSGERVILDPAITTARIYMYFYFMVNLGAVVGQIGMTYCEQYVGFWLAYALPTLMFLFCPIALFIGRHRYTKSPPRGSVLRDALRVWSTASQSALSASSLTAKGDSNDQRFWDRAKPSVYALANAGQRPAWMTYEDSFVDEVRRGLKACQVFLFFPLYWISCLQLNSNLTAQAATLTRHGKPNDVINNMEPLALIIFIPVFDQFIFPGLRRRGINFTPLKRIVTGFMAAALSMLWAAVVQHYIYETSPCGYRANDHRCGPSPLNVWIQTPSYILLAFSEIFAVITGLEYAFTKAPKRMRSLVMALFFFMTAIASVIREVLNPLTGDPLLVWNYGVAATVSFVAGVAFWICFYKLDQAEDELNQIGLGQRADETPEDS